jgi:hypothetical protein
MCVAQLKLLSDSWNLIKEWLHTLLYGSVCWTKKRIDVDEIVFLWAIGNCAVLETDIIKERLNISGIQTNELVPLFRKNGRENKRQKM